jgi:hypothetical protein
MSQGKFCLDFADGCGRLHLKGAPFFGWFFFRQTPFYQRTGALFMFLKEFYFRNSG